MNNNRSTFNRVQFAIYAIAIIGTFLVIGWLTWFMVRTTAPAPLGQERAAERQRNLRDLRNANVQVLNNYTVQPQVRIPISRAMELMVQEWKNPEEGRAILVKRAAKPAEPNYE